MPSKPMLHRIISITILITGLMLSCFLLTGTKPHTELFVCTPSGLTLRRSHSVNSERIVVIPYMGRVQVLGKHADGDIIDGYIGYWYRVRYGFHEGWAYGGYLQARDFLPLKGIEETPVKDARNLLIDLFAKTDRIAFSEQHGYANDLAGAGGTTLTLHVNGSIEITRRIQSIHTACPYSNQSSTHKNISRGVTTVTHEGYFNARTYDIWFRVTSITTNIAIPPGLCRHRNHLLVKKTGGFDSLVVFTARVQGTNYLGLYNSIYSLDKHARWCFPIP